MHTAVGGVRRHAAGRRQRRRPLLGVLPRRRPHRDVSPYAAPGRADDLTGLPPTYVMTAELDPLRDDGLRYATRLLEAGVSVELHQFAGAFHGFDLFPTALSQRARSTNRSRGWPPSPAPHREPHRPRGTMNRLRTLLVVGGLVIALAGPTPFPRALQSSSGKPKATEVGVTANGDPHRRRRRRRQPVRARPLPGHRRRRQGGRQVPQQQGRRGWGGRPQGRRRLHRLEAQRQRSAQRRHHRVRAGLRAGRHVGAVPARTSTTR